jgi:hypothetical protein
MTITTSHCRANSSAADWRCFVGRKAAPQVGNQFPDPRDGLRRLGNDAEGGPLRECVDLGLAQHHVGLREITGEAPHLHVVALPDDDRVQAPRDQPGQ